MRIIGNRGCLRHTPALTESLIGEKEEGTVFQYGASDITAKLVSLQGRYLIREEIFGVQLVVSQKFPQRTVKRIRSGLDQCIDDSSGVTSVLRRKQTGLDLEFRQSINGRLNLQCIAVQLGVCNAIQQEIVHRIARAIDVVGVLRKPAAWLNGCYTGLQ